MDRLSLSLSLSRKKGAVRKPVVYVLLALLIFGAFFSTFAFVPPVKKAQAAGPDLTDEFETGWAKVSGAGTNITQNSSAFYHSGTGSLMLESDSGAISKAGKTINATISSTDVFTFWVYVPTASMANLTNVQILISSVSNYAKYMTKSFSGLHDGWNSVSFRADAFTPITGDSWSNPMVNMRFYLNCTGVCTVYLDALVVQPATQKGVVVINFDDGYAGTYSEAYPFMAAKGMMGTLYVDPGTVDHANGATTAQLAEMYAAGWDLAVHGATPLDTLSEAQQETELTTNRNYLLTHGFTRASLHYAYPGGHYNADSFTALAALGFLTARTTIERDQGQVLDQQYLLTRRVVNFPVTLAQAKADVDQAIASGDCAMINLHQLVPSGATGIQWNYADFEALVDYIAADVTAGNVVEQTITQWYASLGAANVPSAPTVNASSTVSLTAIINVNGNPDTTEYAISCDGDTTFLNYTTNACEALTNDANHWRTYANWGGAGGFADTGLAVNTSHTYKAEARNGAGTVTALSSGTTKYTLANTPSAPTVNATSTTSLTDIINVNSNPASTEFAISCDGDGTFLNFTTNACEAIADDANHWRTYANWGGAGGFIDTGLSANTQHTYKAEARNGDHVTTALSGGTSVSTLAASSSITPTHSTTELQKSLKTVDIEYKDAVSKANKDFMIAIKAAKTAKERREAIAARARAVHEAYLKMVAARQSIMKAYLANLASIRSRQHSLIDIYNQALKSAAIEYKNITQSALNEYRDSIKKAKTRTERINLLEIYNKKIVQARIDLQAQRAAAYRSYLAGLKALVL